MVAALEMYFDRAAERRVRRLWDALEDVGVQTMRGALSGRHRPHVSLISAETLDGVAIKQALVGWKAAPPLNLRFDYIGQFLGRVLWLGPVPDPMLLHHHTEVHARLDAAGIEGFDMYLPGSWVPHCTLSMRVPHAKLSEAIRVCMDVLPIHATIVGAAVADHARELYTPLD
ncbi:MAG TPA: 2'-5' RNA ligase family protein [Candidatus Limnocylindrales bacterium]|nr:2'-5' RNA ligase family protein [Candidatus Limnocylindrales bacterium]